MKNFNYSLLAAALLTGTVVLSSCSSDELPVGNEQPVANELQVAPESAMTFSFSAPAVMGDEADTRVFELGESSIESRFDEEDRVYVYIKSGNNLIYADNYLKPKNLQDGGKKCTLAIDGLSFIYNSITGGLRTYTPQVGDVVYFYYGMNLASTSTEPYYDFRTDGSKLQESYKDYCLAEMVVKNVVTNGDGSKTLILGQKDDDAKEYFTFKNINSIFRQKVRFQDFDGVEVTPEIRNFTITSSNDKIVQYYYPFSSDPYRYGSIVEDGAVLSDDGVVYFSLIFNDVNMNDALVFTAYDSNGYGYVATKSAPIKGFANNKYYYGDVVLKPMRAIPTIADNPYYDYPWLLQKYWQHTQDYSNFIFYNTKEEKPKLFITGNSENNSFVVDVENGPTTITLDNLNAELDKSNTPFIWLRRFKANATNLIISLKGDNVIKMNSEDAVVFFAQGSDASTNGIKFQCDPYSNSKSATLKIWVKSGGKTIKGFAPWGFVDNGFDNIKTSLSSENYQGFADLVDPPYILERSARVDEGDGYYWIFTVKKK